MSISKAIRRGQLLINVPVFMILFGLPGLLVYEVIDLNVSGWLVLPLIVVCFGLAWGYWSVAIPYWRRWAFGQVSQKDWRKLYEAAVAGQLIWPLGSKWNRTEIRSGALKSELQQIEETLVSLQNNRFADETVPLFVRYPFHRKAAIFLVLVTVFIALLALACFWDNYSWLGVLLCIVLWRVAPPFDVLTRILRNSCNDYIEFNEQGIHFTYPEARHVFWSQVQDISLDSDGEVHLQYTDGDEVRTEPLGMAIYRVPDDRRLREVIATYLQRY